MGGSKKKEYIVKFRTVCVLFSDFAICLVILFVFWDGQYGEPSSRIYIFHYNT